VGGVLDLLLKLYQPEVVINNFTGYRTRVDIRNLHARQHLPVNSTHPDIFQTKTPTSRFKKRLTHLTPLTLDVNSIRFQQSILNLQPRS
jgi:lantibiotic modifying enzyme